MTNSDEHSPCGFIVIYRWQVEEAHQEAFRTSWREVTLEGRTLGAFGSCLTRDANGDFLALALWPNEQARSDAFAQMTRRTAWTGAKRMEELKLYIEDDLWAISPFTALGAPKAE